MTSQSGARVVRLGASAENFAVAWRGRPIEIRGAVVEDGVLATVTLRGASSGPEVVGRCSGGYFHPTYRTKEA